MFWNKKNVGLELVEYMHPFLNRETVVSGRWRFLTHKDFEILDEKLNLILNHLNLQYVSETEKKEPAKLVKKPKATMYPSAITKLSEDFFDIPYIQMGVPEKKRTYKKSGKYSKKNK